MIQYVYIYVCICTLLYILLHIYVYVHGARTALQRPTSKTRHTPRTPYNTLYGVPHGTVYIYNVMCVHVPYNVIYICMYGVYVPCMYMCMCMYVYICRPPYRLTPTPRPTPDDERPRNTPTPVTLHTRDAAPPTPPHTGTGRRRISNLPLCTTIIYYIQPTCSHTSTEGIPLYIFWQKRR